MARAVFLLLVLANLVVFVWAAGYLGSADDGREPERLRQQFQPDRLKVGVGGDGPASSTARGSSSAGACRRAGPMGIAEAEAIETAILAQGGTTTRISIDEQTYWVFIPAIDGKPADKDIAALKKTGFKDFSIVSEEGASLNAVSFGYFSKEAAAKDKLERLSRNGIKSARIATQVTPTGKAMLLVRGSGEALDRALTGLNAEPVDCPKE